MQTNMQTNMQTKIQTKRASGFTIIELLVASALLGIVLVFALEMFTANNRTYMQVDSVVGVQQRIRVISDLIERDLRHAGMLLPEEGSVCGLDSLTGPDTLYVSDHSVMEPSNSTVAYSGAEIQGTASNVTTGTNTIIVDSLFMEANVSSAAHDADNNGTNDSDFHVGGGVIVFDADNSGRGTACGTVTAISVGAKQLTISIVTAPMAAPAASFELVVIPAIEYRVTSGQLFRSGRRLGDGFEDLQVSYFFDINGDNLAVIGTETRGDGIGATYLAASNDAGDAREIRVNLVGSSLAEDDRFREGFFQALENRAVVAGKDGFRRRVHTNTVRLRNVGSRVQGV